MMKYSLGVISNLGIVNSLMHRADELSYEMMKEIVFKSIEPTIWNIKTGNAAVAPTLTLVNGAIGRVEKLYHQDGHIWLRVREKESLTEHDLLFRDCDKFGRIEIALFFANIFFKPTSND